MDFWICGNAVIANSNFNKHMKACRPKTSMNLRMWMTTLPLLCCLRTERFYHGFCKRVQLPSPTHAFMCTRHFSFRFPTPVKVMPLKIWRLRQLSSIIQLSNCFSVPNPDLGDLLHFFTAFPAARPAASNRAHRAGLYHHTPLPAAWHQKPTRCLRMNSHLQKCCDRARLVLLTSGFACLDHQCAPTLPAASFRSPQQNPI